MPYRSLTDSQRFASRNSNCMFRGFVRSFDAQVWGCVSERNIAGKCVFVPGCPAQRRCGGRQCFSIARARAVTALGWLLSTLCPEIFFSRCSSAGLSRSATLWRASICYPCQSKLDSVVPQLYTMKSGRRPRGPCPCRRPSVVTEGYIGATPPCRRPTPGRLKPT